MESETSQGALSAGMERMEARLEAAASLFERTIALLEEREASMNGDVRKIVAAVETKENSREAELEQKLTAAELQIAELRAQMESRQEAQAEAPAKAGRKTIPAATAQFLAKQGLNTLDTVEAGALDGALSGLSLEQRIAVKAQLLRAGVVS